MKKKQHTKTLGQVFLTDKNIVRKIITFAKPTTKRIIEIGCGTGILSKELSEISTEVHIIEIDPRWLDTVKSLELKNTTFHLCDVLSFDFSQFKSKSNIIANIPYHITTPIIDRITQFKPLFSSITIMIQKEVAQRILASENSKTYGLLTIFCNYHFEISKGFNVSRTCFSPIPNVDSHVLKLVPKPSHYNKSDEALFFGMARSLFWGRRKTIYNCLQSSPYITCSKSIQDNSSLSTVLRSRGETLSLNNLFKLFDTIKTELTLTNHQKDNLNES